LILFFTYYLLHITYYENFVDIPNYLKPQIKQIDTKIAEAKKLLADPDMAVLAKEEIKNLKKQKQALLSIPKKSQITNHKSQINFNDCIVEIRAGAGGEEAKIWATDLLRMYLRFAEQKDWKVQPIEELTLKIAGKSAYSALKNEAGVHRVQRVPTTEKSGRIHTSTASVAVLPIIPPAQIKINPDDLEIDFYRSGGHGGQNVNKVSTAVRLTHKPTSIAVESSQERTQMQNRQIAEEILRSKLYQKREEERIEKLNLQRKQAVGRAMRAEKIRTYNFPQNRVTDHRIKKSWYNLEVILDGNLGKIIKALKTLLKTN